MDIYGKSFGIQIGSFSNEFYGGTGALIIRLIKIAVLIDYLQLRSLLVYCLSDFLGRIGIEDWLDDLSPGFHYCSGTETLTTR